jgi:hypothetical protein
MKREQIIEKVYNAGIAHYERMIAWAEKQKKRDEAVREVMEEDLGESWGGVSCPFCEQADTDYDSMDISSLSMDDDEYLAVCFFCPLGLASSIDCCGGLWFDLNHTITWGAWLKQARKVLEYIKKYGRDDRYALASQLFKRRVLEDDKPKGVS